MRVIKAEELAATLGAKPHRTVRALALSGGGSKIAFQAGVVDKLLTSSAYSYDVIGGTSCGSLAGSILAQGSGLEQRLQAKLLSETILGIKGADDIYEGGSWLTVGWRAMRTGALYKPTGLIGLLQKYVDPMTLMQSHTMFRAGVVELEYGTHLVIGNWGPGVQLAATRETILASSSMPCFFPVVRVGGLQLVDGGVRDMTPLRAVVHAMKSLQADRYELDVVLCNPLDYTSLQKTPKPRDPLWLGGRALSLLENEVFRGDLREVLWRNNNPTSDTSTAVIHVRVFAPEGEFFKDLDQGTLEFDPKKLRLLWEHGYGAGAAYSDADLALML